METIQVLNLRKVSSNLVLPEKITVLTLRKRKKERKEKMNRNLLKRRI
jgi:hypothetical protein